MMKLFNSPPSPYGRKVMVVAHEKQLLDRIAVHAIDPWRDPPELLAASPLGKVPALITDAGTVLTESTAISEFFDRVGRGRSLIDDDRVGAMARAALAQGLIDAAFAMVIERRRPPAHQWPAWSERQRRAIERTLPIVSVADGRFDLGDIALACGLGYLDFRLPEIAWRAAHPALAGWFDQVSQRPSMQATKP